MVIERGRLTEREIRCLKRKMKRSGVHVGSVFLEPEMNALPLPCFFVLMEGPFLVGVLTVFYASETEAEFTLWVKGMYADTQSFPQTSGTATAPLPSRRDRRTAQRAARLIREARTVCRNGGIREIHTVMKPGCGLLAFTEDGVSLSKAYSEYILSAPLMECVAATGEKLRRLCDRGACEDKISYTVTASEGADHYGLWEDGELVCECDCVPFVANRIWYLYGLKTVEQKRRRGFATRLLGHVAEEMRKQGGEEVRLQVSSRNERAERLYRGLGFVVNEQLDYYQTTGEEERR